MTKLNHIGVVTNHPKRLLDFYTGALAFTRSQEITLSKEIVRSIFNIRKEATMVKLVKDKTCLEVFWFKDYRLKPRAQDTRGYNHFGIEEEKRGLLCQKLRRVFHIKVTKVKRGGHYNYFIRDPDRNIIEIKERVVNPS